VIRVLLDENLPRRLKRSLDATVVAEALTVPECGWGGVKNGALLALAASEFDVFVTMDRGILYQQNLTGMELCLVVLSAVSNALDDLLPLVSALNAALRQTGPGQVIRVSA
jgi:hypothetical protein